MAARSAGLLVLIFLGVVSSAPTHSAFLDSAENYLVEWSFNHNEIIFELTVNTTGWFGLGFSPNGGMPGSDIITAWIKDGQTYIQVLIYSPYLWTTAPRASKGTEELCGIYHT